MSSIRSRRTTSIRVSLDSGGSNASQELINELKEEFRRSLVNTHRASSARNLRPSEILAEKERLGLALDKVNSGRIGGEDGGDGWDDGVECVGDIGDKGGKDSEDVSDSTEWGGFGVYDFLSGQSSDEEEDAEDAALLLNMPVEDSAEIKYVFKKQQGRRWFRRKVFWAWTVIFFVSCLLIAAGIAHIMLGSKTAGLQFWRICFFLASCPLCYLGAKALTFLLVKLVEKTLITKPNWLYIVYSIRRSLKVVLLWVLVLISWACFQFIENEQSAAWTTTAEWILRLMGCISLFFTAQMLKRLIAVMISTVLTINSNQRDRMARALEHEKLLALMMAPRPFDRPEMNSLQIQVDASQDVQSASEVGSPVKRPGSASESGSPAKERSNVGIFGKVTSMANSIMSSDDAEKQEERDRYSKNKEKSVSPLERAQQLERLNRMEKYLRKKNLHVTLRDQLNQVEDVMVNVSTYTRLGQFLFYHLTHDMDAVEVTKDDIRVFVKKEKNVDAAFKMLDSNEDGRVDMDDVVQSIEKVYFQRANLASTLRDNKSINYVLELLIGVIIHTLFVFLYLLILHRSVSELLVGFSGLVVAFSFIFAGAASTVFENAVFIFAVHAYDVGDTLLIDNQWLTVDEITMNFTVCVSGYNLRVWYPNQTMMRAKFVNLSTSLNKWEVICVYVDADTDPSILDKIEEECLRVRTVEHKGEYGPGFRIKFGASEPPFKVGLEMVFEYSHTGINFHRTACARSWMYEAFLRVLVDNGIKYTWPKTRGGTNPAPDDSSVGGRGVVDLMSQQHQQ